MCRAGYGIGSAILCLRVNKGFYNGFYTTESEDNMGNVQLEGEALKCYLMKRFNKTEAEAIQIMEAQKKTEREG